MSAQADIRIREILIARIADMLDGCGHVAVGASSPIPGAAALLAQARSHGAMRVSVLGSTRHNFFTDGGRELFDCAAQGRIDAFFLSGGQIDGAGNINLVGIGDPAQPKVRFPGSFGSAYLAFLVPKIILFREEHTPRTLVEKVDFISAPGTSQPDICRPGGPRALVTGRAVFTFSPEEARFTLTSVHPGETPDSVADQTGFAFDMPEDVPLTPLPDADMLALMRGDVARAVAETYPGFAAQLWGIAA